MGRSAIGELCVVIDRGFFQGASVVGLSITTTPSPLSGFVTIM